MKKYFIIAAAALLSLAACTKNEADKTAYDQSKVINFSAVAGKATKSPLDGTTYKTTFPTFGVYSFALPTATDNWETNSSTSGTYMNKVEIKYNSTDKIWEPESTYFWPISGTLTFTGFSPYAEASKVSYDKTNKKMTVTDYVAAAATADQTDLMWASIQKDLSANQSTYTDESSNTSSLKGVNMVFHHALSQVIFFVKKASGLDSYTVTVNSITFNALSKGTLTVTDDSPSWNSSASTNESFSSEETDKVATSSLVQFGNANMMVPQTLSASDPLIATDQKFTITYSLKRGEVDLGKNSVTVALKTSSVTEWALNTIYKYNITIDLDKIYFNPTVDEWTTASEQAIDVK